MAQLVTLHGKGYTERGIAGKFRYSKTAAHNAVVKFSAHDRKRSGCPRTTTFNETRSNPLVKELLQENPWQFMRKRHINTFQHLLERIWTGVPQADTKATPDPSDEEKETGLCQTSSPLDSRWEEGGVVFYDCAMQTFVLRHILIVWPLGKRFDKKYVIATMKTRRAKWFGVPCRAVVLLVYISSA